MNTTPLARRLPADVSLHAAVYDSADAFIWQEWLSDEERARLDEFGAASRRHEFIAGRAAARRLLANLLDIDPSQVSLRQSDGGAVIVEESEWSVSIAHSNHRALAAAAPYRIGVDLEHIEPRNPDVARFLLRPDERERLHELPYEWNRSLLLCWTLKEAVLKARRTGFRSSPKALHLEIRPEDQTAVIDDADGTAWRLHFAELSGYWASVGMRSS